VSTQTADLRQHSESQPADEAALLITCLRGLPFIVPQDTDWQALLDLANDNGVLLLVHRSLIETGVDLPDFFKASVRNCREIAERFAAELEGLLQQFAEHRIDVLPLKGPALASALYGDATLRSCNDLDLLVRRADYERAETLLFDRGFSARPAGDHDRRFLRDGLPVELHSELGSPRDFRFDLDDIWNRSHLDEFRGKPVHVMSDDDLVLYLCSHGLTHGFSRLIWILDVAQALGRLPDCNYKVLMQRARQQGLEPCLLMGCEVVRTMFPQKLPATMDAAIATSPEAAARARLAASRLFVEDMDVVGNDYRGFYYLQAEPNAIKRLRYRLRHLEPTTEDYKWAERHRINRRCMVVLRPLRLLQKYGVARLWRILFPPIT
jgi:Uncharacterised nucleotidyltransferase